MGKGYFKRVLGMCKTWELVYWWILRLLMLGGIILRLVDADKLGIYQPLQMTANLVGMFAFEICQAFPKNTFPRYFPAYFQNITILGFFLASFGGAFLNFYYIIPAYDKILHLFGCMEAVFISYELICAMQLRDKNIVPARIASLTAFGLAFVFAAGWSYLSSPLINGSAVTHSIGICNLPLKKRAVLKTYLCLYPLTPKDLKRVLPLWTLWGMQFLTRWVP